MKSKTVLCLIVLVLLAATAVIWRQHFLERHRTPATVAETSGTATSDSKSAPAPASAGRSATSANGKPGEVLPSVREIVDTQTPYDQRLAAARNLSPRLSSTDVDSLYGYLRQQHGHDEEQLGQMLKNELLDRLCDFNPPPPRLGELLAQMYHDPNQNIVMRDYAVQHLAAFYEQLASAPAGDRQTRSHELAAARAVFQEALAETDSSIAGTALLAMSRLSRRYATEFDAHQIATTALQMAGGKTTGELTRITAFQVCAQLGATDALPIVWQAARTGETLPLRISAVGALGVLGGPDQVPFLNSLLEGTEDPLKPAARRALNQIAARQRQLADRK